MSRSLAAILAYHSISDGPPPLCVSPARFEAQLELLARAGFEALPLARMLDGRRLPPRCFALTFDDAYLDFAEAALPVLERRGLPVTLFATASPACERLAGGLDAPLLDLGALGDLAGRGVEIGAHSLGHRDLTSLDDAALEHELGECRRVLERATGRAVEHFAYPYGYFDARVRAAVSRHYRSACTTRLAAMPPHPDPFALPRVDAHYLRSPLLRFLVARGVPQPYLYLRRWLRVARGTERRAVVAGGSAVYSAAPCP